MAQEITKQDQQNITTVENWRRESSGISLNSLRAMSPIQAFESPQISLLNKHDPETLGASVVVLLMELEKVTKCQWDSDTISDVAKSITTSFYMLRFDELIYVFRRGKDGAFGKISWAGLSGDQICNWLTKYMETDRLEAEEIERSKNKVQFTQSNVDELDLVPKEKITELVKKFTVKGIQDYNAEKTAYTPAFYDKQTYKLIYSLRSGFTDEELQKFKQDAINGEWPDTLKLINEEIKKRNDAAKKRTQTPPQKDEAGQQNRP